MTSSKEQRAKERRENPEKWPVRVFELGEEPIDDDETSKEPIKMLSKDILCINSSVRMPAVSLPTRTIAVKLDDRVVVISPSPGLGDHKPEIDQFGNVTDLVAPNLFHHLGVPTAKTLFPTATLWGAPGITEKRNDIRWDGVLNKQSWPFQDELALIPVQGMPKINEAVFLHKKSKTLIVCDLCFNLTSSKGLSSWLIFNLFGTYRRFGVSRLFARKAKDERLVRDSLEVLLEANFENIVMTHGEHVFGNAKEKLRDGLRERGLIS